MLRTSAPLSFATNTRNLTLQVSSGEISLTYIWPRWRKDWQVLEPNVKVLRPGCQMCDGALFPGLCYPAWLSTFIFGVQLSLLPVVYTYLVKYLVMSLGKRGLMSQWYCCVVAGHFPWGWWKQWVSDWLLLRAAAMCVLRLESSSCEFVLIIWF